MIVSGGQPPPAGGAGGGVPDALREAARAEDVATHSGQEVIAVHPDGVAELQADLALDTGLRGAGGRDGGAARVIMGGGSNGRCAGGWRLTARKSLSREVHHGPNRRDNLHLLIFIT